LSIHSDAFDRLGLEAAAAVDAVFHEHQIRILGQDIGGDAAGAVVRARAGNGGVDLDHFGLGKLRLEPGQGLGPPAIRGGDAPAQVRDAHGAARFQLGEQIGQPVADSQFLGGLRVRMIGLLPVARQGNTAGCRQRQQHAHRHLHSKSPFLSLLGVVTWSSRFPSL
jgi:hypothetical protein